MKTRIFRLTAALAAALIALLAPKDAQGQIVTPPPVITTVDFPAIGTPEKIEAFAVHTVDLIMVWTWAYTTNGDQIGFMTPTWNGSKTWQSYVYGPLTNKTQMDDLCRAGMNYALVGLMTNTFPNIDKSQGLTIDVECLAYSGANTLDTFYANYDRVYLVKTNGSYAIPDLSGYTVQLNSTIPLYLPGLQWARYEVGYVGDDYSFEVDDVRYDPTTDPIDSQGLLELPTSYMSDSSSTNGNLWITISAFTENGFSRWDGDGTLIPQTPMLLSIKKVVSHEAVTVKGGDSGLGYVIQQSSDLKKWTNCSPVTFFSPTNNFPNAPPATFNYPATNSPLFFRTVTTNLPPG